MGDRGNVVISRHPDDETKIYLYTHWTGSDLPGIVARALDRGRSRWGDAPYLNRIIFSQMLMEGNALGDETGYGIDTVEGDGGTQVYLDHANQTVTFEGETLGFLEFLTKHQVPA